MVVNRGRPAYGDWALPSLHTLGDWPRTRWIAR